MGVKHQAVPLWHRRGEVVSPAQRPQLLRVANLAEGRAGLLPDPSQQFLLLAGQEHEAHRPAMRLDRVDRLLDEGIVVAARVDEGEDDAGQVRQRRLAEQLQAEFRGETPELLAAEGEEGRHHIDRQVVVEELVAGQALFLIIHCELA